MGQVSYNFTGKTVLVTGGASGIGRAIAGAFAGTGASVAVADINLDAAEAACAAIQQSGGKARPFLIDVADEASVIKAMAAITDDLGGLDIAINNAGIEADTVPMADLDSRNWDRVSAVNLSSVFYCMKAQIRSFLARGVHGSIVNTASISGIIAGYNLAAYTATKHGVIGMTRAAAVDYAVRGIRINALCPGLVDTPFIGQLPQAIKDRLIFGIPKGRPGRAEEMARAVLWLSTDDADYVTGHAMVVDGGASLGATATRIDDLL